MKLKQHLPNFFTLMNLAIGCISIVFIFNDQLEVGAYLIGIAAFFDFLDGTAARLLNAKSEIGKQLDSLADIVSFGVAPGFILFQLINQCLNNPAVPYQNISVFSFFAFLIPMFSALRLAKFNIDENQADSFIGLPTPANAIFIASFPLVLKENIDIQIIHNLLLNTFFLYGIIIVLSFLLVSKIKLFSLKIKSFNIKENRIQFLFLIISLLLLIFFKFTSIPIIIILYILLSVFSKKISYNR